jgi:hypothetical protein
MEKVINQAKPYGILYTSTGQEYFLLKPKSQDVRLDVFFKNQCCVLDLFG